MRRLIAPALGATIALALSASSVLALPIPGTLDQQQTIVSSSVSETQPVVEGQTFTAGATGNLTDVGIYSDVVLPPSVVSAVVTPGPGVNLAIAVVPAPGGVPDISATPLFETFATVTSTPGWHDFLVSPTVPVVAGTQYAILAEANTGDFLDWAGDCTNVYSGGQALVASVGGGSPTWQAPHAFNDNLCLVDFAFHDYIDAPVASPTPFQSFQGETSRPSPPPTSTTSTDDSNSSAPWLLIVLAGMAAAGAAVMTRRYGMIRR